MSNFMFQDIIGAILAFSLFPFVLVFPGYACGWGLDLFDFKRRQPSVRLGLGIALSFVLSPILLHLTSSLVSFRFAFLILMGFAAAFVVILLTERFTVQPETARHIQALLWVGGIWSAIAILSLVNIQWGDSLFFSVTSFDQTTRVSVIDAITRTGVPPINPSYYPGHPVKLTFLYYFWYILASMVDFIGGRHVDARAALNASSAWAGLGLMVVIALYLRQRNANFGKANWRSAKIGILLLTVSGLDVIPIVMLMLATGKIVGSVDVWNTWIPSWLASALWVPHHTAALIVGITAMMLAQSARGKSNSRQFVILFIAGLGFASAVGLSMYVTLVFVVFWALWIGVIFFQKKDHGLIPLMIFAGVVAVLFASPFLLALFRGGSGGTDQFPIVFEIRTFLQLESFGKDWSPIVRSLVMLLVLPINYLFELGFFFMACLYWFKVKGTSPLRSNPFYLAEVLLLAAAFLIGSCLRSTLITSNDLGWRAWLPGQFILLIWGVDVIETLVLIPTSSLTGEAKKNRILLLVFLSIGVLTSFTDAVLLRTAWPIMTGPDVPRKYYSARLAYDYLRDNVPPDAITQNNPQNYIDRPSGLFGAHQMVISDRTAYGVPLEDFDELANDVGAIFMRRNVTDWRLTDEVCQNYSIDILILEDADPIWGSVPTLKAQRPPLYENEHYALFPCGSHALLSVDP